MFKGAIDLDPAATGMVPVHCLWMPGRQLLLVGSVADRPNLLNEAADNRRRSSSSRLPAGKDLGESRQAQFHSCQLAASRS